jgi:histidyl-tRNA synthetase
MRDEPLNNLPGTRDILPGEIAGWHLVEDRARDAFARFGFTEIRTPIIEPTELFARGIGGDTDIVGKEMYTFADQSGRSVTLRPEATASVVRSYVQNSMHRAAGLTRLYYIGPMFRHEKKQKGRWRQFFQLGAEVLGSDHPAIEAEVVDLIVTLLADVGIQARLLVNSVGCPDCRPAYVESLRNALQANASAFCEDCRRRTGTNPLRVLDCKVESCQPLIESLPRITESLCGNCRVHFSEFTGYLDRDGVPYEVVPRLVRGLDYYVRTAFEVVSGDLGAQNALAGGGRYDGLSQAIGGPAVQGVGFAMGMDRLVMLLAQGAGAAFEPRPALFVAHMGAAAIQRAREIAHSLRAAGVRCHLEFPGGSLKSQMRIANRLSVPFVLIIGDDEVARDRYTLRRMSDSSQSELSQAEVVARFARPPAIAEPSA